MQMPTNKVMKGQIIKNPVPIFQTLSYPKDLWSLYTKLKEGCKDSRADFLDREVLLIRPRKNGDSLEISLNQRRSKLETLTAENIHSCFVIRMSNRPCEKHQQ